MTDQRQLTQGPISRQLIALSAPLLAGNILQQLYNTVDAVIVGTLLSQFYGGSDGRTFRREFYLSGVFGAGASLALTALGLLVLPGLLQLLQTPPGVAGYAADYLRIIFLGFPAAFAYPLASGVLRAVGNTRAALFFLALSMGVNLALDWTFVARLSMGVEGAALATVLAQALAAGLPAVALATGLGWMGVVTFWNSLAYGGLKRLSHS